MFVIADISDIFYFHFTISLKLAIDLIMLRPTYKYINGKIISNKTIG